MEKREKVAKSATKTDIFGFKRLFSAILRKITAIFSRPATAVRIKEEPRAIYPLMSRREIKTVSAAICKSAMQNAKKR